MFAAPSVISSVRPDFAQIMYARTAGDSSVRATYTGIIVHHTVFDDREKLGFHGE